MLSEVERTCLFRPCSACGGKVFRHLLSGTYQSDEFGTTAGLKIRDRCEEEVCRESFGETGVALDVPPLKEQIRQLFEKWEQRVLTDEQFAGAIQKLFANEGGWISKTS